MGRGALVLRGHMPRALALTRSGPTVNVFQPGRIAPSVLIRPGNSVARQTERQTETWWRFFVAQALTMQADAEALPPSPACFAFALNRGSSPKRLRFAYGKMMTDVLCPAKSFIFVVQIPELIPRGSRCEM
jgi:hypothetical protein